MNIGIMGVGVVGSALARYYGEQGHTVYAYDKAQDDESELNGLIENAEVVFICVGTPYSRETGMLDCSAVFEAVESLGDAPKCVIIKSTVMPGTTDEVQKRHPQHRLFFVPEFLSAVTAYEDYANPRRQHIIGVPLCSEVTEDAIREVAGRIADLLPDCLLVDVDEDAPWFLPANQAELLKLATNAFYALKVTFANEMAAVGMTQDALNALAEDPWIAASHFDLEHSGYRGFGGKCLVKDSNALATLAYKSGVTGGLVRMACDINRKLLAKQGKSEDEWL